MMVPLVINLPLHTGVHAGAGAPPVRDAQVLREGNPSVLVEYSITERPMPSTTIGSYFPLTGQSSSTLSPLFESPSFARLAPAPSQTTRGHTRDLHARVHMLRGCR